MKTLLIVWLLAGRNEVVFQYAIDFPNEQTCLQKSEEYKDKREGWLKAYPVRYADCIVKLEGKK